MAGEEQGKRLDSWKDIAEYLGRDVRTVIRWEKDKGLPVRRLPGGKRQSVFAFSAEIDAWLRQQDESTLSASVIEAPEDSLPSVVRSSFKFRVLMSVAALAAALLSWFIVSRVRRPNAGSVVAPPREVAFNLPSGPLRFLRSEIDTGVPAYRLAAADLNGDKVRDVVFTSYTGDVLGVLLGKGDGTFLPAHLYEGCQQSDNAVIADFNRDGHADVAATCTGGNLVLLLWGKGDGTFPERTEVPVPGGPRFMASADLNADGWPDLVVSAFARPALFVLTNRSGHFSAAQVASFEGAGGLAVADLNGDSHPDIILGVQMQGHFGMALFPGRGDGSFRAFRPLRWTDTPDQLAISIQLLDLDGDGLVDLVFSTWGGKVYAGRGAGGGDFLGLTSLEGTAAPGQWKTSAIADLNLDGKPDILVTGYEQGTLTLYMGNGDGTFAPGSSLSAGYYAIWPTVADMDNDGLPDILVVSPFERTTLLLKAAWKKD